MTGLEIAGIITLGINTVKRFFPNRSRTWANPLLAIMMGLGLAYANGGSSNVMDFGLQGLEAAAAAMGIYSVPKAIGNLRRVDNPPVG